MPRLISNRWDVLIVAAATAASLGLHVSDIAAKPLWVDEAEAWWLASAGAPPVNHPDLYFVLLRAGIRLCGDSEGALRLPSALAAAAAVVFVWVAARVVVMSKWQAVAAALFTAVSPYWQLVSQQARMYAVTGFLAAVFAAALLRWRKGGRWFWLVLAVAAAAAGVNVAYSFGFAVGGGLALWPWSDRRRALTTAASFLTVILAAIPTVVKMAYDVRASGLLKEWHLGTLAAGVKASAGALFYFAHGFLFHPLTARRVMGFPFFTKVMLGCAAFVAGMPLVAVFVRGNSRSYLAVRLTVVLAGSLAVNVFAPSGAEQLAAAYPFFVLLWIWGLGNLPRALVYATVIVWAAFAGVSLRHYCEQPCYPLHDEDWRSAGEFLREELRPGDVVVTWAGPGGPAAVRYYAGVAATDAGREGLGLTPADLPPYVAREASRHRMLFLCYGDWGDPNLETSLVALGRAGYDVAVHRFGRGLVIFRFAAPR